MMLNSASWVESPGKASVPLRPEAQTQIDINLPEYDLRRAATCRDPLAVVEAYRVQILLRLAAVLGVRMCPNCPRCNEGSFGCQDRFGSSMRPMGGVLGGLNAFGGGTEHQDAGTPHFHGQGHVVSIYQFGTLDEIASQIRAGTLRSDDLKEYQAWYHA